MKHTLKADGAPFNENGQPINEGKRTAGSGRGQCSCGAQSNVLESRAARKLWHNGHKTNPEATAPEASTEKETTVTTKAAKKTTPAPAKKEPEPTPEPVEDREGWELEFQGLGKYYAKCAGLHGATVVGAVYGVDATLTGTTLTLYGDEAAVDTVIEKLVQLWADAKDAHRAYRKNDKTYSEIDKSRKNPEANAQRWELEVKWFTEFMNGAADALAGTAKRKGGAYKDGVNAAENPGEAPAPVEPVADEDDGSDVI